jgi:hypothetical protein
MNLVLREQPRCLDEALGFLFRKPNWLQAGGERFRQF